MGVLEITLLGLKTDIADPELLPNLRSIRSKLGTNSRFFATRNVQHNHRSILIIGVWSTLQAHYDFLSSENRDLILGPQEGQTSFTWSVHVDLGPGQGMEALPLNSWRGVSIARLSSTETDGGESVMDASRKYLDHVSLETDGQSTVVVDAWRLDAAEGVKERVIIVGRDNLTIATDGFADGRANFEMEQDSNDLMVSEEIGFDLENEAARRSMMQ